MPSQPIFSAWRATGSIIGIDIGQKKNDGKSPSYLAIEMCDWYLSHQDKVVIDCIETDDNLYKKILGNLAGKRILSIEKTPEKHEIKICIENAYFFVLTSNIDTYGSDAELFFLLQDGKPPVGYSPEKGFSYGIQ
ncbi:MAG: hypothetical protein ACTHOO_02110 [Alcanivorax sp.]